MSSVFFLGMRVAGVWCYHRGLPWWSSGYWSSRDRSLYYFSNHSQTSAPQNRYRC